VLSAVTPSEQYYMLPLGLGTTSQGRPSGYQTIDFATRLERW
jgi:hypothetical protein